MTIDKNPRIFFIDAVGIEANVDADADEDFVRIEFAGRVTPTVKKRIENALLQRQFDITEKKLA